MPTLYKINVLSFEYPSLPTTCTLPLATVLPQVSVPGTAENLGALGLSSRYWRGPPPPWGSMDSVGYSEVIGVCPAPSSAPGVSGGFNPFLNHIASNPEAMIP